MTESQTRPLLSAVEARALAVLLEKERTVPDSYPMSLNALLHGCNQRSNRDPVMNLDESQLLQALEGLREQSLVIESSGSRVTRYEHNMGRVLGIPGEAAALLAVLMLRGPQTAAELRAHVERLARFADTSSVEAYLHEMAGRADGPLVVLMPRQPGAREQRWRHCLSVPADAEVEASGSEAAVGGAGASGADGGPQDQAAPAALMQRLAVLEEQVQALGARVQALEAARMPSDGA
ncbi:MAG: YceH family protein [Lautropia sp.]|nr:YceH family protein [Lautropia sp.]